MPLKYILSFFLKKFCNKIVGNATKFFSPIKATPLVNFFKIHYSQSHQSSLFVFLIFVEVLEEKMECSKKFVMVFTICLMVLLAFGNVGVLAAEAPAPSPSMESAGVTLFVPLLMAVVASMAAVFF